MRKRHVTGLSASICGGALLALVMMPDAAVAKIDCKGIFQVTKNGLISTPYCQEEEIARVARSYGWDVTAAQVRANPLKKVYLCRAIGDDVRLKGACGAYSGDTYR